MDVQTEILNPPSCVIEEHLPDAPPGGVGFNFGLGDRPDLYPDGSYFVGENPVIDVVMPADIGRRFPRVSILDVSGKSSSTCCRTLNRQENSVPRSVQGRRSVNVRVRVPGERRGRVRRCIARAFGVDETMLGKSKIIVVHSATALFPDLAQ